MATEKRSTILYVVDEENDALLMELAFKRAHIEGRLRIVKDGKEALPYLYGVDRSSNWDE